MVNKDNANISKKDEKALSLDLSKVEFEKSGKVAELVKKDIDEEMNSRKKKAKIFLGINLALFLLSVILLAGLYYFINRPHDNPLLKLKTTDKETSLNVAEANKNLVERKIDGVMVPIGEDNNFLLAVMIDNHADARPHAGIAKANLVFEAEVEGGMTRIMGVFSSGENIKEIGPVRSARPYFVDWARELSALYAHVGGSPDALVKIQRDKVLDINEFFNGKYFWRDTVKKAPHNVYTSSENLEKYLSDKSADRNRIIPWLFKDDAKESERATSSVVRVTYKLAQDKIEWKYERTSNYYLRYVDGAEYRDKSGEAVLAKNLVIMEASAMELDDKLRLEMDTIGTGKAQICMEGKCALGSWGKNSPAERTRFFYDNGQEVGFDRGMTWIQVVRPGIVYSSE